MLKVGSTGSDVQRLQKQLQAQGYLKQGKADGEFGKQTKAAVEKFQKAKGLKSDGTVGASTSNKLFGSRDTKYFDGKSDFQAADTNVRGNNKLVNNVRQVDREMSGTGRCAKAVNEAIGRTTGTRTYGHANQLDTNLVASGKFRKVNMSLEQALKTPGLVLTWERTNTKAGSKYGHTAITTGDGHTSISDYTERDTLAASRRMNRRGLTVLQPTF